MQNITFQNGYEFLKLHNSFKDTNSVESACIFSTDLPPKNPLFTIAIPTYKRLDTLKETIESALNQDIDKLNGGGSKRARY
ncbi:hypothetical protein CCY99_06425 [Helicobacter sp. 16-1353]|uniref:glycosyltransferase n=1 Tax=Helicobacter sp. 16-1353 TaxID=2004996 RepID=UPI000DCDE613|nr:glycosyltransferase [Helicobacter sp. 16-1353]RAX53000.1 hypothetical protein CCY99_06425 [Helicobacter sp. 16-1353]